MTISIIFIVVTSCDQMLTLQKNVGLFQLFNRFIKCFQCCSIDTAVFEGVKLN